MDKRKSLLNVSVSIGFKLITMLTVIVVKRFLIKYCGNEVNGLNALYLSIIGFLAVAELGVGSAISFCMYRPIVEGDNDTVAALYHLFRRVYMVVGGIILLGGLAITPFINVFAKDYQQLDVDLQLTFVLMLISVVIAYLFSCKTSLINAYKNNYITTTITSSGVLLQHILQIVVLIYTHSFVAYLVCRIVVVIFQWSATEIVARKKHAAIISNKSKLSPSIKNEVIKNIKAMFMHKIGNALVNTVDSVVISTVIGVVVLGLYSNYLLIMTSMTEVIKLVFTSLTSVVGHLYVKSKTAAKTYCERFHFLNFTLGCIFFLGYYAIIDELVAILFSSELVVTSDISFVIALNGFVQFMRQTMFLYRSATGVFYYDRWKPLFEGMTNLVLSIIFVQWIGVTGVLVATIITNLLICHIIEPYVLYKNAFEHSPKKYYVKNYCMILVFVGAMIAFHALQQSYDDRWVSLLVNGFISVGVSGTICLISLLFERDLCAELFEKIRKRIKKV